MLALIAQYINKTTGQKVIVVVPSQFLHAYQQHFYCPSASRVPDLICDSTASNIFYCSFGRFNDAAFVVPINTVILVDEFHELFFNQPATIVNGKVVSPLLKLKAAAKLIGVSATYRGEAGINKITSILETVFIKTVMQIKTR
jgi:hypothetical protein